MTTEEQTIILIPMQNGTYQIRAWGSSRGAASFARTTNMGAHPCLALSFPAGLSLGEISDIVAASIGHETRVAP